MAPDGGPAEHRHDGNAPEGFSAPDTAAADADLKAKLSRKRTKTGCMTCRKRRIKCGEERPICKNCIKSKRHCEGYNQRVALRPPTFEYQPAPNGGAHITFQVPPPPDQTLLHQGPNATFADPSLYGALRPRPDGQQYFPAFGAQPSPFFQAGGFPPHGPAHSAPGTPNELPQPYQFASAFAALPAQGYAFPHQGQDIASESQVLPRGPPLVSDTPSSVPLQHPLMINTGHDESIPPLPGTIRMPPVTMPSEYLVQAYEQSVPFASQHFTAAPTPVSSHAPQHDPGWQDVRSTTSAGDGSAAPMPASSRSSHTLSFSQPPAASNQAWTPSTYVPRPELAHPIDYQHNVQSVSAAWLDHVEPDAAPAKKTPRTTSEYYKHAAHVTSTTISANVLTEAAVETQDDDYFDVEPDEEEMKIDAFASERHGHARHQTLSRILALTRTSYDDIHTRRYDTFLQPGILDHYRVEEHASPLRNGATARVFAHFISATGPSLSIFERHPRNTSIVFTEGAIPLSQQGLWTYRMPMAALRNQGLLHAMLALASLHIARLQNGSVTPSMQHYAWALRRIHASVGKPHSRLKVATIAASMLLGFYEVMTADHAKWNLHLAGSMQLFVETDFVRMTREFRRLKRERAERTPGGRKRKHSTENLFSQNDLLDQIPDIDENVISSLTGKAICYEKFGVSDAPETGIPPRLDLTKFEILKDLYWWYCKQDVYQSIVSGNPLLMDFSRWAHCPPRAPLGKPDAVYGSFDHLVLLLGRIADFAANDRKRKLRQIEANGGHWRPDARTNTPRPPPRSAPTTPLSAMNASSTQGYFRQAQSSPVQPMNPAPTFYGMAPPPKMSVHMPASYTPMQGMNTPQTARSSDRSGDDLQKQTETALVEYGRIRAALLLFEKGLGGPFEPLSAEHQVPMEKAFGTTKFYRSYDIGCLWAVYNMAMIITIRSHPNMPPAAHYAAALASHETAIYAQEIGRIAAGIVPGPADQPLNPSLGAALCESCMPSFFAAIQYQDAQQRDETIDRIWGIAKRTGWGSAELIANGIETAWVKAAAAGRGPPYQRKTRTMDSEDPRLNGTWEHFDPSVPLDENNDSDRRLVRTRSNARLTWAWGVLGVEEDVEGMRI